MATVVFLVIAAILVAVLAAPEFWLLLRNIRARGIQGTRVRLRDGLVGETVAARGDFARQGQATIGQVTVDGEIWSARSPRGAEIASGDRLRVTSRDGLTLLVEPAGPSPIPRRDGPAPSELYGGPMPTGP